ncbi:uncharacterized protein TAF1C-like [Battus philenor]|uniref:uncharacterized protein TAF1C-like n=1 Tax=Battus philenor TaxID=42288 RepID=UPI0035D135C3
MATPGKLKKKKKDVEFTAENIDNTAPVKKIVDDLRQKNGQAYNFFCQNIRQRLTTKKNLQNFHFIVPGHPLNSFTEDWDGQLITNYFEPFTYKSLNPKIITKLHNVEQSDPVTLTLKVKSDWLRECRNLRVTASCSNMLTKYESLNEDVVHCPQHLVDMAMHLDSDPDPYFDSSYNWYYSGHGNLQHICVQWSDYLLHSEFSKLYLSDYNRNEYSVNENPVATFDCGEGVNILETIYSMQNIIALRTKNRIFILRICVQDENIQFEKIKVADSILPYTGISFDGYHRQILYVTTIDNKLTIVNLDRLMGRSVKLKAKASQLNNWSTVLGSERGFYTHISTNSITLYDKRTNNDIYQWTNLRNITDELGCNNISCALPTEGSSLYFGTDHHLFLMDLRYVDKHKPKPMNRWTHGMQCVPTYISKCNFEFNKELICLSSQWCEDMCVISSSNDAIGKESDSISVTMPYRPPNILSTLKAARNKLLCYDLYNPIDSRLNTAITGLQILEHDDKFDVLMQNSFGDISCHTIFPDHLDLFMEDNSCERLDEWSKSYKRTREDFEVSSIVNIADVWKKLKKVPDGYKIVEGRMVKSKFSEEEIVNNFEKEELDEGLLELWSNKAEETVDNSSFALNLHFSDSDEDAIK